MERPFQVGRQWGSEVLERWPILGVLLLFGVVGVVTGLLRLIGMSYDHIEGALVGLLIYGSGVVICRERTIPWSWKRSLLWPFAWLRG